MKKLLFAAFLATTISAHASDFDISPTPENIKAAQDSCYARLKPQMQKGTKIVDVGVTENRGKTKIVNVYFDLRSRLGGGPESCNLRVIEGKIVAYNDTLSQRSEALAQEKMNKQKAATSKAEALARYK